MRRPALQQLCSPERGCVVREDTPDTRLIALGSAAITEGFNLIGFETLPDATAQELDELLGELVRRRQKALVLVEDYLARGSGATLERVRMEGGRIVVAEIPALHAAGDYHPQVEELILSILGPSALEERP